MKEARGLATKIIVPKIDLKSLLKRPLKRSPVTEDRAGAEGGHIEKMLKELQHLDAGRLQSATSSRMTCGFSQRIPHCVRHCQI